MSFKEFLIEQKHKSDGETKCKSQVKSILDHLLKVFIAQDSSTAQVNGEWERQINNFVNIICEIRLKNSKRVNHKVLCDFADEYLSKVNYKKIIELLEKGNFTNNKFFKPMNVEELNNIIKKFVKKIFLETENGQNKFISLYPQYLKEIKEISKKQI